MVRGEISCVGTLDHLQSELTALVIRISFNMEASDPYSEFVLNIQRIVIEKNSESASTNSEQVQTLNVIRSVLQSHNPQS